MKFGTEIGKRPQLHEMLAQIRNDGTRVLVVGFGVSGREVAAAIAERGVSCLIVDRNPEPNDSFRQNIKQELTCAGCEFAFGVDGERVGKFCDKVALAVVSPAVSSESAVVFALRRRGIPIVTDLEFAIHMWPVPSVVVTGTNGKSTCVALIQHLLKAAGKNSLVVDNETAAEAQYLRGAQRPADEMVLITAATSHQLDLCSIIRPDIGVFLNIAENHLERHGSLERYAASKARLFANQDEGCIAVINADDPLVMKTAGHGRGGKILFSSSMPSLLDNPLFFGEQAENGAQAAAAVARLFGVSDGEIARALATFAPLAHRFELLEAQGGRVVIDDCKSLTPASVLAALRAAHQRFPQAKIILLAGGLSKAGSWAAVSQFLQSEAASMRAVICFGHDAALLMRAFEDTGVNLTKASRFAEAVARAWQLSEPGDVLLCSPGCSSFDEFSDFRERGSVFQSQLWKEVHSSET